MNKLDAIFDPNGKLLFLVFPKFRHIVVNSAHSAYTFVSLTVEVQGRYDIAVC